MSGSIYDRFSKPVCDIVIWAKAASIEAKVGYIYPESLAIGILTTGENEISKVLANMDIDLDACLKLFKKELSKKILPDGVKNSVDFHNIETSKHVVDVCKMADDLREKEECKNIEVRHVFKALMELSSVVNDIFTKEGVDVEKAMEELEESDKVASIDDTRKIKKGSCLKSFCTDVTELAKENKLDPIIAREKEIESAITILCRRIKNNPILLGEPGVGKTAIVEGIAQRIVSKTVPKQLMECKVYSLNLASLVAGTKYRGEFEERIQHLVKEIKTTSNCILFIDEIHGLVGAGSASGALDASNILKPFLARGDLRCIGATTLEDYKKYFSKDGALTRRFQQVMIEEPTKDQMHQILAGIKERFEKYHDCIISEDAIDSVINLSDKYLNDRNFPDKAIDCIDTTCAKYSWESKEREKGTKPIVTAEDIAKVISEQSQIPIEIMLWDNYERVKKIEETLEGRVIGQSEAIKNVCSVLKNAYSGVRNPNKPIGSFVFGGQSGTGKTYMAKELAKAIFGKETSFVKLDMTEFSESHSGSKLIGSPPGYVGFRETDLFIDKIKRKPYCVILLDELEKAHSQVIKLFLQVMSDGIMTDASNNHVSFKNTILIMTGNFGVDIPVKPNMGFNEEKTDKKEHNKLVEYCKDRYGSEFINRVDEFIVFNELSENNLKDIAKINLREVCERLGENRCKLSFSDSVFDLLIKMSKEEHGKNATLLNRLISKYVQPCISDALFHLENDFYSIIIDVKDDKFINSKRKIKKHEKF